MRSSVNSTSWGGQEQITANDEELVIKTTQDVQPILDHNKERQGDPVNPKSGLRHAASIPMVIWQEWNKEFQNQFHTNLHTAPKQVREKFIKQKLNDPANKFLRTWQGRL